LEALALKLCINI